MLYLIQTISQDTKTGPSTVFLHATLTFSYPEIGQAYFDKII